MLNFVENTYFSVIWEISAFVRISDKSVFMLNSRPSKDKHSLKYMTRRGKGIQNLANGYLGKTESGTIYNFERNKTIVFDQR